MPVTEGVRDQGALDRWACALESECGHESVSVRVTGQEGPTQRPWVRKQLGWVTCPAWGHVVLWTVDLQCLSDCGSRRL